MKLIAWNDKPVIRIRDIEDFTFIFGKYSQIFFEEICNEHYDLLNSGWDDYLLSSRVLGRDMSDILKGKDSITLKNKILEILDREVMGEGNSDMAINMARLLNNYSEENVKYIKEILKGIRERI